ncbi:hypothetical protein Q8A67_001243 [Cirrhinus molitorella]|uniref:Ig-like domain-containing protein n=1 Tax=Cirrhinus molitorella TaxID=172907 RepID=A0AA88TZI0_9TELE|nr:hypothetical protein Q8A67_001243 [Cirrhinus molitorella]
MVTDGFTVHGPIGPLVAPLGSSVVLPCYVVEHLPVDNLEVEWRRADSETLVHLFLNGESRPEAQQQDYHDRAHFFTDQIQHGNFSLRLDNLTAEDEGRYTCAVDSQQDSGEILVQIKYGFIVRGPSGPLVAPLGSSVVLPCYVDEYLLMEGLEVEWRRTDSETLVHLYQDGESRPESQQQDYHDRAHFFTDQIHHGNFSLRLDNLKAEDKGRYICTVYSQQDSGQTDIQIKVVGLVVHSPFGPLVAPLGSSVVLPCYVDELLLMEGLEVEWRRTDSGTLVHLYQDGKSRSESQHQDYHDRAHFFTEQIQHGNFSICLDNLRAEDKGRYTCRVNSQQDFGETMVEIKDVERLLVSGSSRSIFASVGEDVTLNCSVDSHITPEHIEEVSWKKTDEGGDIVVLLYQSNKTLSDSSVERYRDRVEFFTDEIPKGNFSLRLKSVRTEDKGLYMCQAFAGELSGSVTVELERLGFSVSHIMMLILCISASGSALLLSCLIYCRSQNSGFIVRSPSVPLVAPLGSSVVLPCYIDENLLMEGLKVEWRRTDSETLVHLYQDDGRQPESQQQDYHDRAHFFTDQIQHGNFSLRLDKLRAEDEGQYTCRVYSKQKSGEMVVQLTLNTAFHLQMFLVLCPNILMFLAFVLWGVFIGSQNETISCCALYCVRPLMLLWAAPYVSEFTGNIKIWILNYSYRTEYVVVSAVVYSVLFKFAWAKSLNNADFDNDVVTYLFVVVLLFNLIYIIYLFVRFIMKSSRRIYIIFSVLADISFNVLPSLQFILLFYIFGTTRVFFIVAVLPVFLIVTRYDWNVTCGQKMSYRIGWACMVAFLQLLWAVINFTWSFDYELHRVVPVYVFGSVGVVVLNSVTLMTELILKTVNGVRSVEDLRVVVFPSEFLLIFSLLILRVFKPWMNDTCLQSSQNVAECDGTPANGSNQNMAESYEMSPLQAAFRSGMTEEMQPGVEVESKT